MSQPMTRGNFASKIEWEGGIFEALDYGLKHTDLSADDPDAAALRAAWAELEAAYDALRPLVRKIDDLLEEPDHAE